MASGDSEEDLVIALIGKDGVGKSTTGKTIVGRQVFKSGVCGSAVTLECQCESTTINGRALRVVDSPGLDPTHTRNIISDIVKLSSPGINAVLVCIRIGRFTDEDHHTVEEAKKWFGRNIARHLIIVFTGADHLEDEEVTEEEFIQSVPPNLRQLLEMVDHRYLTVNNRAPGGDVAFVETLLALVVGNNKRIGGVRYTRRDFIQATEDVEKEEASERQSLELKRRRERDEIEITFKNKCAKLMEEVQLMQRQVREARERKVDYTEREGGGMGERKRRLTRVGYSQQRKNIMLQMVSNEERHIRDLRQKEATLDVMKRKLEAERAAHRAEVMKSEERQRRLEEDHRRRLAAIDAEMNKQQQVLEQRRAQAQNEAGSRRRRNGENANGAVQD